jgi:peptidoglycan/xylan/chitin deacetylase (PgdA/CDA1 family)
MKSYTMTALAAGLFALLASHADAACVGDSGVSRTLRVDTSAGLEVGTFQYPRTLPLGPREVVITIDDGPMPGVTDRILAALRGACVKATFFMVGTMAAAHPALAREVLAAGHTVGTHSYSHPVTLAALSYEAGAAQIDRGIEAVTKALGRPPAPFFRFPGLGHTPALTAKLAKMHVGVFGVDAMAFDWALKTPEAVRQRALHELEKHNGGILLIHDIQPQTAAMLPQLLKDMQARGFRIVHIVPAHPGPVSSLD